MKKLSILVIIMLIVGLLAVPVLAAQSATMSVSASKSTVYRGDTITVTVSASKVDNCTSGGFMFSYDKNVFEYVSGSATLSGYTAGVSTAAGNVAGYFMNGNTTVQGGIFQITLKVKDNAAFGSYTISGVPNMSAADGSVSCSAGSTTVTVSCNHNYGSWSKVDDTNHGKTCSICQNVQKEAHKWDNGTTIKQANCKEGGQIKYTCTTCSATKTTVTAKTNDHKYGSWTKVNDTTHKHTCSVCSKEETANHSWNGGSVTKQPTCKEEGVKTYTCTACNATKTESVAKTTDHKYGSWTKVNDTTHKHTCSVCSKEETANHTWDSGKVTKQPTCKEQGVKTFTCTACNAKKTESIAKLTTHTYDHGCDTDCNVCGVTRTTTHNYKTTWSSDKTNHWHECSVCKDKKDLATHIPGAEATETTAQTCTICSYIIKPALGHKHSYATKWTADDKGHWYACSGCAEKGSYADHIWNDGEVTKDATETETGIKTYTCTVCNTTKEEELDVLTPIPTTEPSVPNATEPASTTPVDTGKDTPTHPQGQFPWWIILVAVIVVGGGVAAFIITKKKKN